MERDFEGTISRIVEEVIHRMLADEKLRKHIMDLKPATKKYLNKKEVCEYIGVSYVTAEKYIFNSVERIEFGKAIKFDIDDIDSWMEIHKVFTID